MRNTDSTKNLVYEPGAPVLFKYCCSGLVYTDTLYTFVYTCTNVPCMPSSFGTVMK